MDTVGWSSRLLLFIFLLSSSLTIFIISLILCVYIVGNFLAGQMQGTILKKKSGNEEKCFEELMKDVLRDNVPEFKKSVHINNECKNALFHFLLFIIIYFYLLLLLLLSIAYIELEDLLANFNNPSIMDIKMGVRTYLEEELIKAGEKPKLRKDMYEKMVAVDPNEPLPHEHAQRAVTKPRYMVWRESISSTSTLGFRIDGVKLKSSLPSPTSIVDNIGSNNNNCRTVKDFKRTKTEQAVQASILQFADNNSECIVSL